jgi:tRNA (guanine-N7-)-methyltransferase
MPRLGKLEKIAELKLLPNVFEKPEGLKGNWHSEIFENNNPITIEIGCGRGEYTVSLARMFPERNFIGVDIKGPRIWKGAKIAHREGLNNVAFIRSLIENLTDYFAPGEVDEIWVTFPDPYTKPSKAQKRLVSQRFLTLYREFLRPGGTLHFKTDNTGLFQWALGVPFREKGVRLIEQTDDLYRSPLLNDLTSIQTYYEALFSKEGHTIKYARIELE